MATGGFEETDILYEDRHILVCHKPAGVAVQTKKAGEPDMESLIKNYLSRKEAQREKLKAAGEEKGKEKKNLKESGEGARSRRTEPELYVLHRLDQPVEGLLLFAKTKAAASAAARQDGMEKKYYALALTEAVPSKGRERTLLDFLLKDGRTNTSAVVGEGTKGAKRAELSYCLLLFQENRRPDADPADPCEESCDSVPLSHKTPALFEITLKTGRHHQIRVQFAHAGMPLLGDLKYGDEESLMATRRMGIQSIALCACELSFAHPVTGKPMKFSAVPKNPAFALFLPVNPLEKS